MSQVRSSHMRSTDTAHVYIPSQRDVIDAGVNASEQCAGRCYVLDHAAQCYTNRHQTIIIALYSVMMMMMWLHAHKQVRELNSSSVTPSYH